MPDLTRLLAALALGAGLALAPVMANAQTGGEPQAEEETEDGLASVSGLFLAARLAEADRNIPRAAEYYRRVLELQPDSPVFLQTTFLLELADGRMDGALQLAERLVAGGDANLARLLLGARALKGRQHNEALRQFEAFRGESFGAALKAPLLAWAHAAGGNTDEALAVLDAAEGPPWLEIFTSYNAGLVNYLAGRFDAAVERFARTYELDSRSLRTVQTYAAALDRVGLREEARTVLEAYLAENPGQPSVLADLMLLDEEKPLAPPVLSPSAGAADVLNGLGAAIGRDGGEEVASIYLNLALYLDPENVIARIALGEIYESLGLLERAAAVYEPVPDTSPFRRRVDIRLGIIYERLEKPDETDAHMAGLIETDPSDLDAITVYGNILRIREDYHGAIAVYTAGIGSLEQDQPQDWPLYYARGIAYERTGQWPLAEADFLKALELSPEEPDVLNYLGYTWADMGIHLDRAIGMLERAVELRPDSGYIIDSLGWVYYRLGRYDDALQLLERAVLIEPQQGEIQDHLGDVYWRVGRRLEARFQWSHALEQVEDAEDRAALETKLRDGLDDGPEPEAVQTQPENAPAAPVAQ
ncbi:MAG: tetratricopeptide repeat protein [Hyphomicrobiaceae bacterium]|nr:tetratricopeptide repeat protein [Hyphomicrobiaceae bacterium]